MITSECFCSVCANVYFDKRNIELLRRYACGGYAEINFPSA